MIIAMAKKYLRLGIVLLSFLTCFARAEDFFFNSAGARIHYTVDGQGDPVVLIHGFGANIATNWAQPGIISALADTYQVIAIDNRGHGQSDKPHDPQECGSKMVEDVIRLMDHLKIRRAHIVGYSMGGRIAVLLLAEHPDRLFTATIGGAGWLGAQDIEARRDLTNRLAESLEQGNGAGPLIVSLAPRGAPPLTVEQIGAANRMLLSSNDPLALAAATRGMSALQPTEATLRANKVPVLALAGELDPTRAEVEKLAEVTPNLKLVVIPAANHMTAFRNAEFLKSLKAFLEEHSKK